MGVSTGLRPGEEGERDELGDAEVEQVVRELRVEEAFVDWTNRGAA